MIGISACLRNDKNPQSPKCDSSLIKGARGRVKLMNNGHIVPKKIIHYSLLIIHYSLKNR